MALAGGVWAATGAHALDKHMRPTASERYLVRSGDTLWSIARHLSPGEDPRPFVDALAEANGVDPGSLVPGQALVVPRSG